MSRTGQESGRTPIITSLHNHRVAEAVRLKKRAMRETDRRFLVEGARGVLEALRIPGAVREVFFTPSTAERLKPMVRAAGTGAVATHAVSDEVMAYLTSTVTPPGLVAVAGFIDMPLSSIPGEGGCVAVLAEVRDPGNAGTILRSADAAGAGAVVFTRSSVDVYNAKAVRASAGSLFHVPVVREVDLENVVRELRRSGRRVLGASADGRSTVYDVDLTGSVAVLFGNEAHGLPEDVRGLADDTVRVPILGTAESLNLAAAATIVLFEAARQRSTGRSGEAAPAR